MAKLKYYQSKDRNSKKLEDLQKEKNNLPNNTTNGNTLKAIDEKMATVIKQIEKEKLESDIKKLENVKKTNGSNAVGFKLKEMVIGRKEKPPEKVVLIDPVSGNEANTPGEIKRISIEYCYNLLTKKDINEKYREQAQPG